MIKGWTYKVDSKGNIVWYNPKIVYTYPKLSDKTKKLSA